MHAVDGVQWTQRQPRLVLRPSSQRKTQGLVFLTLHFPHGPGDYISLSKLPTGFSGIFKLGEVREILVAFISGKVPFVALQ